MATPDELKYIWRQLVAAYPANKADDGTAAIYAATLSDIEGGLLKAAVLDCISRIKFFPTVSELREAAATIQSGGANQTLALEAWGEVKRGAERYGRTNEPQWSDDVIAQSVRALGWVDFCNSEIGEEMSWRARFVEIFDQLRRRQNEQARMLPVVKEHMTRALETRLAMSELTKALTSPVKQ